MSKNKNQPIKGYKVFKPDWTCMGFQYEVGKTFEEDVTPSCCNRGFHFCKELKDCFSYYLFDPDNKVAKVIALGEINEESADSKCCTNKIQIVEEISWEDVLRMVNLGKGNTGLCNSGNCNTGYRNTGDYNTGYKNTGDYNIIDASSGCFCTEHQKILIFDKLSNWTIKDWLDSDARYILDSISNNIVEWIYESDMTDIEKEKNPTYKTTGGYLKILDKSEAAQVWWDGLDTTEKNIIKSIPNFDAEKFQKCTGIKVD